MDLWSVSLCLSLMLSSLELKCSAGGNSSVQILFRTDRRGDTLFPLNFYFSLNPEIWCFFKICKSAALVGFIASLLFKVVAAVGDSPRFAAPLRGPLILGSDDVDCPKCPRTACLCVDIIDLMFCLDLRQKNIGALPIRSLLNKRGKK